MAAKKPDTKKKPDVEEVKPDIEEVAIPEAEVKRSSFVLYDPRIEPRVKERVFYSRR